VLRGHERDRRGARVGAVGGIWVAYRRNGDSILSSVTDGVDNMRAQIEEALATL
jgi:hypothetical protein